MLRERLGRALTTNRAATDPRSDDPRLLGRTYAIPFDQVWTACLVLVERPRHWTLLQAHDLDGYLSVECQTPVEQLECCAVFTELCQHRCQVAEILR